MYWQTPHKISLTSTFSRQVRTVMKKTCSSINLLRKKTSQQSCFSCRSKLVFSKLLAGFLHPGKLLTKCNFCFHKFFYQYSFHSGAATGGVLKKSLFLKISQNSQESTCTRISFLIKLQASTY